MLHSRTITNNCRKCKKISTGRNCYSNKYINNLQLFRTLTQLAELHLKQDNNTIFNNVKLGFEKLESLYSRSQNAKKLSLNKTCSLILQRYPPQIEEIRWKETANIFVSGCRSEDLNEFKWINFRVVQSQSTYCI